MRSRLQLSAAAFIALSSTCPHLGCQVHWESQNNRFFCPCHNGVFDPAGTTISGPPAESGKSLPRYPLKIEGGLLFIEVPLEQLACGSGRTTAPAAQHVAETIAAKLKLGELHLADPNDGKPVHPFDAYFQT